MAEYTTITWFACGEGPSCSAWPVTLSRHVELTWLSLWLDAYTATAMKHDVEADEEGPGHGPCDQDEKRIKDE